MNIEDKIREAQYLFFKQNIEKSSSGFIINEDTCNDLIRALNKRYAYHVISNIEGLLTYNGMKAYRSKDVPVDQIIVF